MGLGVLDINRHGNDLALTPEIVINCSNSFNRGMAQHAVDLFIRKLNSNPSISRLPHMKL